MKVRQSALGQEQWVGVIDKRSASRRLNPKLAHMTRDVLGGRCAEGLLTGFDEQSGGQVLLLRRDGGLVFCQK